MELCDTLKYDNDFEIYIKEIDLAEKRKQNAVEKRRRKQEDSDKIEL